MCESDSLYRFAMLQFTITKRFVRQQVVPARLVNSFVFGLKHVTTSRTVRFKQQRLAVQGGLSSGVSVSLTFSRASRCNACSGLGSESSGVV